MNLMTFVSAARLAAVLALAVLTVALTPAPGASASGFSFTIGSASGAPGGLLAVDVTATAPEPGIGAFTLDVVYDENSFTVTSCRSPFAGCNKDYRPGQVRIAGVPFTPLTGDRLAATIIFQARPGSSGTSALDVQATDVFSGTGDDLVAQTQITDGTLTITPGAPVVKQGDANCDGAVNELDGLAILNHVSGADAGACIAFADANCDNRVDVKDAIFILEGIADFEGASPPAC